MDRKAKLKYSVQALYDPTNKVDEREKEILRQCPKWDVRVRSEELQLESVSSAVELQIKHLLNRSVEIPIEMSFVGQARGANLYSDFGEMFALSCIWLTKYSDKCIQRLIYCYDWLEADKLALQRRAWNRAQNILLGMCKYVGVAYYNIILYAQRHEVTVCSATIYSRTYKFAIEVIADHLHLLADRCGLSFNHNIYIALVADKLRCCNDFSAADE